MAKKTAGKKTEQPDRRLRNGLEISVLLSPFLIGLFFPWTAAAEVLWLLILLVLTQRKTGLCVSLSPCLTASVSIPLFLLLGGLWGADHGMALPGVLQFLPLPLFVLLTGQLEPEERPELLRFFPESAAVMVLLSALLSRIPGSAPFFLVNGRQGGFFQYPNTYALYLLTALVLLLFGRKRAPAHRIVLLLLLSGGILFSGSRTVMALLLVVLVFFCFWEKDRRLRLAGAGALILMLGGGALYVLITGSTGGIGRFWSSSLSSSELLGRFLYARDALPVILRHPLGLGYMGYLRLQGSFQTGVYTVTHVHNEFLQLLLDAGWIPAVLLLRALLCAVRGKEKSTLRLILLAVICLHCLLDFDTQFTSVAMLFFLAMDTAPKGRKAVRPRGAVYAGAALLAAFSVWIGTASGFLWNRDPSAAAAIYPGYTTALIRCLPLEGETTETELADRILSLCDSVPIAWDIKAREALSQENTEEMMRSKREAIRCAKYSLPEYQDYILLLERAVSLPGISETEREACRAEMAAIPGMLEKVKAETSVLGWKIRDLPNLELSPTWLETVTRVSGQPAF